MTYQQLQTLIESSDDPVMLLEGRRSITLEDALKATAVANQLARDCPELRFRSGNAQGSDEAFSKGVVAVDATRLQIVAPYKKHRMKARYDDVTYDSPESMSIVQEQSAAYKTITATPKNKRIIERRNEAGRLAAKASYLIRDTMKVVGHSEKFPKPVIALFYVDLNDPEDGGTGHTIRVCRQEGVPCVFQDVWQGWIKN